MFNIVKEYCPDLKVIDAIQDTASNYIIDLLQK